MEAALHDRPTPKRRRRSRRPRARRSRCASSSVWWVPGTNRSTRTTPSRSSGVTSLGITPDPDVTTFELTRNQELPILARPRRSSTTRTRRRSARWTSTRARRAPSTRSRRRASSRVSGRRRRGRGRPSTARTSTSATLAKTAHGRAPRGRGGQRGHHRARCARASARSGRRDDLVHGTCAETERAEGGAQPAQSAGGATAAGGEGGRGGGGRRRWPSSPPRAEQGSKEIRAANEGLRKERRLDRKIKDAEDELAEEGGSR